MQNLLPASRLQPATIIHLTTPKTAARSTFIVEAVRQAGCQPKVESITLSAMPAMAETFNAVKSAIEKTRADGHGPVVNFTGGTKLMSIGGFSAALNQKAMSVYSAEEYGTEISERRKAMETPRTTEHRKAERGTAGPATSVR